MKQKARAKALKFAHRGIYKGFPIVDPVSSWRDFTGEKT